jgi:hypothetical protein
MSQDLSSMAVCSNGQTMGIHTDADERVSMANLTAMMLFQNANTSILKY